MTKLAGRGAIALALLAAAVSFPGRAQMFILPELPIVSLWTDPEAQHRLQLGRVPYDSLRSADAVLPRDASVLLVTSDRDVRHLGYTTFHRALYFLTPRPVWWVSPAAPDGTWESRWWISVPLTTESIRAIATEKHAAYVLVYDLSQDLSIGRKIADWDNSYLLQVDDSQPPRADQPVSPIGASALWPLQLLCALTIILCLGYFALRITARLGHPARGIEAAALAWAFGAGLTSLGMLGLNALGIGLSGQILILTLCVLAGLMWHRESWALHLRRGLFVRREVGNLKSNLIGHWQQPHLAIGVQASACAAPRYGSLKAALQKFAKLQSNFILLLLLVFFALQIVFVAVMAAGRPLDSWDSWVTWGMKARTIFLDGRISPAVYADPSRAVTHLDYPLLVPLIEAWLFGWLGAPDDRLAGVVSILFYLALLGIGYSAVRRRAATRNMALSATVVLASIPQVALLAGIVYADIPLAVFATIAIIYWVEWRAGGSPGTLLIAALAAGLIPWTKREGLALLVVICLTVVITERGTRRAWLGVGALVLAAALLSGPWWIFVARNAVANPDFLRINLITFGTNLSRLPTIAAMAFSNLSSIDWSFVWPLAVAFGSIDLVRRRRARSPVWHTDDVLPATALVYLGLMSLGYVFSAFVPYQQHVASSFFRLIAHVVPLPVLWMAYRSVEFERV